MGPNGLLKVAVLGSASASKDLREVSLAFEVGGRVASKGAVLMTGGCPGIPQAALNGAIAAGGITVGVSPATSREEHCGLYSYPLDAGIMVFTGMGTKGRNVILIRSADACIFIGGGMGTLNEFTIAFDEFADERAIGVLKGSGGFSGELPRLASMVGRSPRALLVVDPDPERLVDLVVEHCSARGYSGGERWK